MPPSCKYLVVLRSFLLIHLSDDLSLLIFDLLVYLGTFGRLVSMHPGWCSWVFLSSLVFPGQVLSGGAVVLRFCCS